MEQLLPYVETVGSMLVTLQGNYSKNKLLFGFYSWLVVPPTYLGRSKGLGSQGSLVVNMVRWFVSQQVPSARPLGLGSKLYPSNMQRMLNKDLAWFMQSLFHVLQNRVSKRKALLAGCTSCCSKFLIFSKIFREVLKLLRPSYIFHALLFLRR